MNSFRGPGKTRENSNRRDKYLLPKTCGAVGAGCSSRTGPSNPLGKSLPRPRRTGQAVIGFWWRTRSRI